MVALRPIPAMYSGERVRGRVMQPATGINLSFSLRNSGESV